MGQRDGRSEASVAAVNTENDEHRSAQKNMLR